MFVCLFRTPAANSVSDFFFFAKEMYFEKKLLLTIMMMIVSMIKMNETKNRSENKAKENILARHKNTMTE